MVLCLSPQRLLFEEGGRVDLPCGICEECKKVFKIQQRERYKRWLRWKGGGSRGKETRNV